MSFLPSESEGYNWGTPPFPKYPHETVDSMAEIGEAFMDAMPEGYSWCQSPAEIIADLTNERDDARQVATEARDFLAQVFGHAESLNNPEALRVLAELNRVLDAK